MSSKWLEMSCSLHVKLFMSASLFSFCSLARNFRRLLPNSLPRMSLLPTSPLPSTPAQTVQSETPTAQNTVIPKKRKIKVNSRPLSDDDELLREDVDNALSDFYRDRGLVYDVAEKKTVYPPFRFLQEVEVEVVSQTANGISDFPFCRTSFVEGGI